MTGLSFTIAVGPRQRSHFQVRVPQDSWPNFTVSDSRLSNLEGQVPVFVFPRNRVAQLYPQAMGSLFVASYGSQGYGGGIRPRLRTGWLRCEASSATWNLATNTFTLGPRRKPTENANVSPSTLWTTVLHHFCRQTYLRKISRKYLYRLYTFSYWKRRHTTYKKQEILRRTNRLLPFNTTRTLPRTRLYRVLTQ
jgi:hypothetical protein